MARNILFINDHLHCGGVELVLQKIVAALAERGDKVTIWAIDGDRETLRRKYPAGVRHYRLPFWEGACTRFTPKWFYKRACRVLFEGLLLRLKKWDVVVAFKEGPSMKLASRLLAKTKLAWIHTDYSNFHWSGCNFHSDEEELQCMASFDRLVCASNTGTNGVISTLGDPGNICVRHNPLDVKAISAAAELTPEDCKPPVGKPLLVSVGRLSEVKRYGMLMDVCKRLEAEFDFEMWIVGGGELEAELREQQRREDVKSVRLLGNRDNPYPYVRRADWFVSSSASECHPIAIQEALVLGVPVIAARCPAVEETLPPALGIITESNAEGLEAGLRRILSQPELASQYKESLAKSFSPAELWQPRIDAILELMK